MDTRRLATSFRRTHGGWRSSPSPCPRPGRARCWCTVGTLVSAGTELKAYVGEDVVQRDPPYPRYPGYSHVGVVERAGAR